MLDRISQGPAAILTQFAAIFVSLELSRSNWVVTSLSPGNGEKMSRRSLKVDDLGGLLALFAELRRKAKERTGSDYPIITIHEAGLDGFWLHRALQKEGVESHVVDPASIAAPRKRRRAKTDKIDGEALLRALLAFKRGEPRVCAMVVAPSPEEEDRRRLSRERQTLLNERVTHVNRIKGLLFSQGVSGYQPLKRDRRKQLEKLRTGDGRLLPSRLKAQISRELDRLECLLGQIKLVDTEQAALLAAESKAGSATRNASSDTAQTTERPDNKIEPRNVVAMLLGLRGIGEHSADVLWSEALCRQFSNRRQVASYAGLAATPWRSGGIVHEQGLSKAGNPRLRTMMVQLSWLWVRNQQQSALTKWFKARGERGRKTSIIALARKLLVALWKYVTQGVVIEGAVMKPAA
jgi:transposase